MEIAMPPRDHIPRGGVMRRIGAQALPLPRFNLFPCNVLVEDVYWIT
jgi:hypothetical protein